MKTIKDLKSLTLSIALGLAIGAGILSVQAWTEPTQTAPGGTLGAPLNTTSTAQSKAGSLGLGAVFSPTYTLDVRGVSSLGTLRTTGGALLNSGNSANGLLVQYGNVGIGTTTPSTKLHVVGGARITGLNAANCDVKADTSGNLSCGIDASGGDSLWTASGTNIYNSNTGNVGIGNTAPGAKLDILTNHTSQIPIRITHNAYNDWVLQKRRSDNSQLFGIKEENSNGGMGLVTGNTTRLTITNGGNVGIGTTAPLNKLHVYSTTGTTGKAEMLLGATNDSARGGMLVKNAADPYNLDFYWSRHATSNAGDLTFYSSQVSPRVTFKADGKVGIGTTSPASKLDVVGGDINMDGSRTIYSRGRMHVAGEEILYLLNKSGVIVSSAWGGTGTITANAFMYASDEKLKDNINKLQNASDVLNVDPVTFNWKKDGKSDVGVIAQDVEKYFPEFVTINAEGNKTVDYPKLVVPLIGTVKEQQNKIDDLEKRLEALENK